MDKKISKRTATKDNYVYSQEQEQWIVETSFLYGLLEYDTRGNVIKEASYNIFGDFDTLNIYKYDEKGFLIEQYIHYDEDEVAETHRMENREDGKPLREFVEYQDGSLDTVTFTYDADGNLLEEVEMDADGIIESHDIYEYSDGKMVHETIYGPDETRMTENTHTYDENGNLVESKLWNSEAGDQGRVVHEYDEKGQRTETLRYNASGQLIARTIFILDEKGNVVELEEEDTTGLRRTKIGMDENGNMILQEETNEAGELNVRIERMYNEDGEQIESSVFIDRHDQTPEVYYTIKYEFEYYS
jgi:YD repeat-containing protein